MCALKRKKTYSSIKMNKLSIDTSLRQFVYPRSPYLSWFTLHLFVFNHRFFKLKPRCPVAMLVGSFHPINATVKTNYTSRRQPWLTRWARYYLALE